MSKEIDKTVAAVEEAYAEAYSAADASRLAAIFTTDATVQTEWGPVLDGQDEIAAGLVALFAANPTPDALVNTPTLSREVARGVIVSHGTAVRHPKAGGSEEFLYTRVYVERDGSWLLAANQIARPSEHPRPTGIGDD